jgi:MFS family permease
MSVTEGGTVKSKYSLVVLAVSWFSWFWICSYRMMFQAFVPDIQQSLALSIGSAGLLIGISGYGRTISGFLSGFLTGLLGRKKTIIAGITLTATFMLLTSFTTDYLLILILQLLAGLGFGTYLPSALSLLSELFSPETRGRYIGIHEIAAPTGFTVGPILGGLMLTWGVGWAEGVQIWVIPAIIILISQLILVKEVSHQPSKEEKASCKIVGSLKLPSSWSLTAFSLLAGALVCHNAMFLLMSMLPVYWTSELNVEVATAAFIFGVVRALAIVGQLGAGYLSDIFGRYKVLLVVHSLGSLVLLPSAYLDFGTLLIAILSILSVLYDSFMPVLFALISDSTPPHERSKMIGFTVGISTLSIALAPTIIGVFADNFGFRVAWIFPITLSFLGIPLLALVKSRLRTVQAVKV